MPDLSSARWSLFGSLAPLASCIILAACSGVTPAKPHASTDSTTATGAHRPVMPALSRATVSRGWFTADQAVQGKQLFDANCARCHGVTLAGGAGPALVGANFFANWGGRTLSELYSFEHTEMPLTAPGSLTTRQYVDITAFLLERNGFVAGAEALSTGSDLSRILSPSGPARDLQRLVHGLPRLPPVPPARVVPVRQPFTDVPSAGALMAADTSTTSWLTANKGYLGYRYTTLTEITPENADRLHPVCQYITGETGTFEGAPLMFGNMVYFATTNGTYAIDAGTCHEIWSRTYVPAGATWNNTNRGIALAGGRIFRGTIDGHLLAYDALTGLLLWDRDVTGGAKGQFIAAAPLVYGELVLVGHAGGDLATTGGMHAFSVSDGTPVWHFNTVPDSGSVGADTWERTGLKRYGGGAVWTSMSLDPATGVLYFPVGNPAPDFNAALRPGSNLFSVSVVALDANTGRLKWYFQGIPGDYHDWDMSTVALVEGKDGRQYVAASGKHGLLYLLDRATGARIWEVAVTTRENVDKPLDPFGVRYCPGTVGGVEWNGPAWSPPDGVLFVNAVDWCVTSILGPVPTPDPGLPYTGLKNGFGTFDPIARARGWVNAVEVSTGRMKWRREIGSPMIAGLAPTSGGLLFTGDVDGNFLALESATGRGLYSFFTGGSMGGGVITYQYEGRQLVAATTGNSSRTWFSSGSPTVILFGL